MATNSATGSSDTTSSTSVSIKQEVLERDTPPTAVSGAGEAAAVAAAAAAAVVQRHFRLGLTASPSAAMAGRRSTLAYSVTAAGSRAARMHSTAQPETCVCEVCQVELGRYEALFCHKLLHFNTANVCYVCDLYFTGGVDELRVHVATHHRDIAGLHPKASDTAFVCPVCVQRFSTSKALMRHQAQLHSPAVHSSPTSAGRKVMCAICTVDFANERELLAHLVGAQHKDMKVKLQSIFICIDCRSIFSNRDAYAFHMMTRAQNETCDVITAAAAAAAAEVALCQNQNGDVTPSSLVTHQQALASPPPSHGHRQASIDARRVLAESSARQPRSVSDRYSSARTALAHLGGRFDDHTMSRRWLTGRIRNGPNGRVALPLDKTAGSGSSLMVDSSAAGGGHLAPLNLTCQTVDRRSTTAAPQVVDDTCRNDRHTRTDDWSQRQSWPPAATANCSGINGVGVTQRRSMSARSDIGERQTKIRRRSCWSVDNISDEPTSRPTLVKPAYYDDLVLNRRHESYSSPSVSSCQQKDVTIWQGTRATNSTDFVNYCNNVVTSTPSTPSAGHSSSSVGIQGNAAGLSEPVPDRLLVDAAWSRIHPPGHDGGLLPGGDVRDGPARECSVVAHEPGAADEDDDDALRQLLRLIQQPDGQPVFLCRHCDIIYADRMLYVLHMGLHNVNNPWQCNICGTTCSGRQQFALHALHY